MQRQAQFRFFAGPIKEQPLVNLLPLATPLTLHIDPSSSIRTGARSSATCILANLAMRHATTLDWDEKAYTVKQPTIKPYLKAKYRSPWKLEV